MSKSHRAATNVSPARPHLALLAALAAVIGAIAATFATRVFPPPANTPVSEVAAELQRLGDRLSALERSAAVAAHDGTRPLPVTGHLGGDDSSARSAAPEAALAELQRRLVAIEQRLAALPQATSMPAGNAASVGPNAGATAPAAVSPEVANAELRRQLLTASSDADKLKAWRTMRGQAGSWDDATVAEMVRVGLSASDATVRADVWRQADALDRHAALVPALLQAMASDVDASVREEAAETIANYFDHPGVAAALAQAASSDAEPRVRRQARESIDEGEKQQRRARR